MKVRAIVGSLGLLLTASLHAQGLPEGWSPIGGSPDRYTLSVTAEGYSGTGLSVIGQNAAENFGGVGQIVRADNYRNSTIRLSGYLRTIGVERRGGLWMRIDGYDEMITLDNMLNRGPGGTTGWQEYSVVLRVPENAKQIVFGVILSGNGELRADELRLEVVPDNTPTTSGPATDPSATPASPRGLSF